MLALKPVLVLPGPAGTGTKTGDSRGSLVLINWFAWSEDANINIVKVAVAPRATGEWFRGKL